MSRLKPCMFPRCDGQWLYAIGLSDGRIKVGHTSRPRSRAQQHRTAFGATIVWAHLGPRVYAACHAAHGVERRVIEVLAKCGTRIGRTEFFRDIDKATVLSVMREANALARATSARLNAEHAVSSAKNARLQRAWDAFRAQYRDPLDQPQSADQPAAAGA